MALNEIVQVSSELMHIRVLQNIAEDAIEAHIASIDASAMPTDIDRGSQDAEDTVSYWKFGDPVPSSGIKVAPGKPLG